MGQTAVKSRHFGSLVVAQSLCTDCLPEESRGTLGRGRDHVYDHQAAGKNVSRGRRWCSVLESPSTSARTDLVLAICPLANSRWHLPWSKALEQVELLITDN
uniref:(northern house mosquito) hypothetical protein n=1 Tax=Culex pipiens TaxID=7175 RepID=A0A8D8F357_CULPI